MSKKCEGCHKKIVIPIKECDESGLTWHGPCFRCSVCRTSLNELTFQLRDNKLYCRTHVIFVGGPQPVSKCYSISRTYRIVF